MHCHDADLAAGAVHVALDREIRLRDRRQEQHEGGRLALLVVQRQAQKLVDGVARLGAQPLQYGLSAAIRTEHAGIKAERAAHGRPLAPAPQPIMRGPEGEVGFCRRLKGSGEAALATDGKALQLGVSEADERRFQNRGQGEVVVRQQGRPAEGDQVHDGDVLCEHQSVRSGHGHARELQGADHCLE